MSERRPQTLRRRLDNLQLRWSARLDSDFADRVFPWVAAGILFAVLATMALARAHSLDNGEDLGAFTQLAWLISEGEPAHSTIRDMHLFAEQAGFAFYPVARLAGILPAVPTMLVIQSALLALGVVPVWRIARRVADLRVGAGVVLMAAYALYPAVHELNLSGFHTSVIALPALLGAIGFALTDRWRLYAACVALVLLTRADLAVALAGFGVLLVTMGRRRAGWWTAGVALGYLTLALAVVQPYYADGTFVHADAFEAYGSSPLGVAWGMVINPLRVVGDVFTEENFRVLVLLLAPVFFLPLVAPRWLAPVVPLQAFYLVANVADERVTRPEHAVAATAFVFVAAVFALQKIGTRSVERVNVPSRVLGALLFASIVFFVQDAPASPYREPWAWGSRDASDHARVDAADRLDDPALAVRASPALLPLLAERTELYALDTTGNPHVRRAAEGVDAVVFDADAAPDWDDDDRRRFREGMAELGFSETFTTAGISAFERVD